MFLFTSHVCVHTCYGMRVEVRGQLSGLFLPPCGDPQVVRLDGRRPYPQVLPTPVCFLDVCLE